MNTKVNEGKLISGKEALIALVNGEDVEYEVVVDKVWKLISSMSVNLILNDNFRFRLKPCTITINGIEVPAPFEPKEGDRFYFLSSSISKGYALAEKINSNCVVDQFGAWRTEEEIKQVVAALRQVFGGSHDN